MATSQLVRQIGEPERHVQLRQGVVTAVAASDGTCSVRLGGVGATAVAGVRRLAGASVTVGMTVWVLQQGYDLLVIGPVALHQWGSSQAFDGLELYHVSSTPYIDFHRGANPAGDGNADYNMRLINNAAGQLHVLGGQLWVNSSSATNLKSEGAGAGLSLGNRDGAANPWVFYSPQADDLRIWRGGDLGYWRYGENTYEYWGAKIGKGSFYGDFAGFAHWSKWSAGNYALLQGGGGDTYLNASSGTGVYIRNANNNRVVIGSGSVEIHGAPLALYDNQIRLRVYNDSLHRVNYTSVIDGVEVCGNSAVRMVKGNGRNIEYNSHLYTNHGWGLDVNGALNSSPYGANSGGTLKSVGGGNIIRIAWDGTLRFYVEVTNVKNFVINHPQDDKRHLIHACLEGPEAAVFYRGQGQLENGWVEVRLPDYFEALCAEEGRSVQLTSIADDPEDEWCPVLHATYPKNGRFFVGLGSGVVAMDQRFWWQVTAVRKDVDALLVEPLKKDVVVMGSGPYTYYKQKGK